MLSFHNDPLIKEKYISRVRTHRKLDNIIQGTGWENGKGCAVGCTLENYDHSRYPIELGIPEWLAYLEDRIFEGLPNEIAKTWPERFLQAIPVGKSLKNVRNLLAIKRLTNLIDVQKDLKKSQIDISEIFNKTVKSIEFVIKCHKSEINNISCDWSAAESAARSVAWSARSVAWSAAWSARSAARSAAWSAESAAWSARSVAESAAESAACSARSVAESVAESVAWSAAWSAESAAESARSAAMSAAWSARSAAWIKESENLIEILNNI